MKKANIYKAVIKDKSAEEGKVQITCVAENIAEAVRIATPAIWNSELNKYEVIKYKESDIIEIMLVESGVCIQDYISEYNQEE